MNPVSPISRIFVRSTGCNNLPQTYTNLFPLQTDPYNTPYESINWAETLHYYPQNGIQYINPYQRRFLPTNTEQLNVPFVIRTAANSITTLSLYN